MRYHVQSIVFALLLALSHASGQSGPTFVGSGYGLPPSANLSPGQIVTFWVTGLKPIPVSPVKAPGLPLPATLSGISVTLSQTEYGKGLPLGSYQVPLLSVTQTNSCSDPSATAPQCFLTSITVQIPFELVVDPFTMPPYTTFAISQDGVVSQSFAVSTADDSIHVLTTCGAYCGSPCVTHPDGTLVLYSSPAQPGETIVIYAVGLGATTPSVPTGQATPSPAPTVPGININFDFRPNAAPTRPAALTPIEVDLGAAPAFAGLTPGQVGLYQINVQLPATFPPESYSGGSAFNPIVSNLTITIGSRYFSYDGAAIWVQLQQE